MRDAKGPVHFATRTDGSRYTYDPDKGKLVRYATEDKIIDEELEPTDADWEIIVSAGKL